jgi:dipeptidase
MVQDVWKARDPYEEQLFSERDHVDSEALELYKKNPEKALEYLTAYSKGKMETVLEMYNGLHDQLIVKYSNSR